MDDEHKGEVMKKKVPDSIQEKYKLPQRLTDFQLLMYVHLIEWKWKHITKEPGVHSGREYDAILPASFQAELQPLYRPIAAKIRDEYDFKVHKHFGHMASSQAACINLFTVVLSDENVANRVLPRIHPGFSHLAVDKLENGFRFEYWDERNPLNDHTDAAGTDSDVAIAYYDDDGRLTLWLIEHKLTEDEFTTCGGYASRGNKTKSNCRSSAMILGDPSKCYYQYKCEYKYWDFTTSTSIYDFDVLRSKKRCPFIGGANQLWRNQLMAEAVQRGDEYEKTHFSVVYHPNNPDLQDTIDEYKQMLLDGKRIFSTFTSKQIVKASRIIDSGAIREWADWYSDLYRID